jgi:Fuc2NAc and GlcNAc transferase
MNLLVLVAIGVCSAIVGAVLTWLSLRHAVARGMLDVPNARSSHVFATPRGGGIAIAATALSGTLLAAARGSVPWRLSLTLFAAGAAVAVIGYLDDRHGLSRRARFAVHVAASAMCVLSLSSAPLGSDLFGIVERTVLLVVAVLAVAWAINLFNFMDGIDGFAASQGTFVAAASAMLAWMGGRPELAILPALTAGACCGFLLWNRPPARIFMGDVGSGFLGLWLAALALLLSVQGAVTIWTSIVLSSAFIADATTTLVRRVVAGRRWYEAHRSHAYQNLARRWQSHARVTALLWVSNLLLAMPVALLAQRYTTWAPLLAAATVLGFAIVAVMAQAGVEERPVG